MAKFFSHATIERNVTLLGALSLVVVAIGGIVEIAPLFWIDSTIEKVEGMRPYTPLEQAGRNIYMREGCYNCHSQMIRPFRDETERYGHYSLAAESMYDHPFQWGSKRTGPDLAREGGKLASGAKAMRSGKRDNLWHFNHLMDPRQTSPGSNMPPYPWLFETKTDFKTLPDKIAAQVILGVPWPAMTKDQIEQSARDQAVEIATSLTTAGAFLPAQPNLDDNALRNQLADAKVVAIIAYLQKIGTYEAVEKSSSPPNSLNPDSYRPGAVIQK